MGTRKEIFFDPFLLDIVNNQLWRGADRVMLRPKAFEVLRYLVEHPKQLISTDKLLKAVWPEVSVTAGVVKGCIREIRSALEEDAAKPLFIETVPRRGYQFIGATESCEAEEKSERSVILITEETKLGRKALEEELHRLKKELLLM